MVNTDKVPYYTRIINAINSASSNDMFNISIPNSIKPIQNPNQEFKLGSTFNRPIVNPIKLNQGQRDISGRCGNNIIFGSNNGQGKYPFIKIRNSQQEQYDNE